MLDPAKFAGPPQSIVDRLWEGVLKPAIEQRLDRTNADEFRHKDSFSLKHERHIVFRDTKACLLNANGFSFRDRTRVKDGRRELTLKFRAPDIFLAAQSKFDRDNDDAEFEEDIAPWSNERSRPQGRRVPSLPAASMRSLFSRWRSGAASGARHGDVAEIADCPWS